MRILLATLTLLVTAGCSGEFHYSSTPTEAKAAKVHERKKFFDDLGMELHYFRDPRPFNILSASLRCYAYWPARNAASQPMITYVPCDVLPFDLLEN